MNGAQMSVDGGIGGVVAVAISAVDDEVEILGHVDGGVGGGADGHTLVTDDDGEEIVENDGAELVCEFETNRVMAVGERSGVQMREQMIVCVVDAEDKQWIKPNCIYFAPANYHLLVERGEFNLSTEGAVLFSRPSVDVLFESAADAYRDRLIAVVLTGANSDGANGVRRVNRAGGFVIAQDPATAEATEMPQSAIDTGRVDRILPLERIGPYLVELSNPKKAAVKAGRA